MATTRLFFLFWSSRLPLSQSAVLLLREEVSSYAGENSAARLSKIQPRPGSAEKLKPISLYFKNKMIDLSGRLSLPSQPR